MDLNFNELNELELNNGDLPEIEVKQEHLTVTSEWLNNCTVQDLTYWSVIDLLLINKVCACFQGWVQGSTLGPEQLVAAKKILDHSWLWSWYEDTAEFDPIFAILKTHLMNSRDPDLQEFLKAKALENSLNANTTLAFKFYEVLTQTNPHLNRTLLHYACEAGDISLIRTLDLSTIMITSEDAKGFSSLHLAVKNGHVELVDFLLEKIGHTAGDVNVEPYPDYTDLVLACALGDQNVLSCFIRLSAHRDAFRSSSSAVHAVESLLSRMLKGQYPKEKSLVHMALEAKQIGVACQLMEAGVDPVTRDNQGRRPLELLVENCDLSSLGNLEEVLVRWKPADWTLMQTACTWGIDKLAFQLIDHIRVPSMDDMEAPIDEKDLAKQKWLLEAYIRLFSRERKFDLLELIPEEKQEMMLPGLLEAIAKKNGSFVVLMMMMQIPLLPQFQKLPALGLSYIEKSFKDDEQR